MKWIIVKLWAEYFICLLLSIKQVEPRFEHHCLFGWCSCFPWTVSCGVGHSAEALPLPTRGQWHPLGSHWDSSKHLQILPDGFRCWNSSWLGIFFNTDFFLSLFLPFLLLSLCVYIGIHKPTVWWHITYYIFNLERKTVGLNKLPLHIYISSDFQFLS